MPTGGRPTVRSRQLGTALKHYREAAKLDQQHAADHIAGSKTKISRMETGQVSARPGDVRLLLELYGVEDRAVHIELEQLARESNKRGWWLNFPWAHKRQGFSDFATLETDATYIRTWQPLFIPGLLQTDDYVRALMRQSLTFQAPEAVEDSVTIRQTRRRFIEQGGSQFAAVIWEPALTAPLPSPKVHREQLMHIAEVAQQQNVSIQVLPLIEWRAAHLSPHFTMLSLGAEPASEVVAYDTTMSTVLLESLEDMAVHAKIFEALRSAALTPDQSLAFIRQALKDIPADAKESE